MKNNNKVEKPAKTGKKLQTKQTLLKGYNFTMFIGCGIATYILVMNGNTTSLKVLAGILAIDAAVHAYKLVAVVE